MGEAELAIIRSFAMCYCIRPPCAYNYELNQIKMPIKFAFSYFISLPMNQIVSSAVERESKIMLAERKHC
jgi:hypothetical protein